MTIALSSTHRNARAQLLETRVGAGGKLNFYTGAMPGADAAASGTLIASIPLPTNFLTDPVNGVSNLVASVSDTAADATGTPGYFRFETSAGVNELQGTVTVTGGGGDITLDDVTVDAGQAVTITAFTYSAG
jgi:hypothetical protein